MGQVAIATRHLDRVLDEAVRETAQALGVGFCKILKVLPGSAKAQKRAEGYALHPQPATCLIDNRCD